MYKSIIVTMVVLFSALSAQARNDIAKFEIKEALSSEDAKAKLSDGVKFYFGKQKHAAVKKKFGEFSTNKKTNAFGKSDKKACSWVFLSAMMQMQKKAKNLGANAIVNIRSYYKKRIFSSKTQFECGAGNIVAGVALKGDFVNL